MTSAGQQTPLTLGVVVIGRNEGQRLARCLDSIAQMDARNVVVKVLYVDSKSTDVSLKLAQDKGARTILLDAPRTTAAMGRNAGWHALDSEFILFLDGDTTLHVAFATQALAQMNDRSVAVVWGHRRETATHASLYNRVLDLDWIYAPGDTAFCGGDAMFRRQVLERTGGFDETLIAGEEPELCRRITIQGLRIVHLDRPMTGHDLAITSLAQYWRRATRAGHAFAEVSERFRHTPDPFWLADAQRNRNRALILLGGALAGVLMSLILESLWPLLIAAAAFLTLVLRTAWKARWKTKDRVALLLYGLHSHLQQIPIFAGQLSFFRHRQSGTRALLVEYKRP